MRSAARALQQLLDSWSADKLSVYSISPYRFNLLPGQKDYTLGPGADFDVKRPLNIEQATITPDAVQANEPINSGGDGGGEVEPTYYEIHWLEPPNDFYGTVSREMSTYVPVSQLSINYDVFAGVNDYVSGEVSWDMQWTEDAPGDPPFISSQGDGKVGITFIPINAGGAQGALMVTATVNGVPALTPVTAYTT
jgi:hypothetical protein